MKKDRQAPREPVLIQYFPIRSRELAWVQPRFAVDRFELREEEHLLGELVFTGLFSSRAEAATAHGAWTFDRPGFWRREVAAFNAETGQPAASLELDWRGNGQLVLPIGRCYTWQRTRLFRPTWQIVDPIGRVLVEIEIGLRWFKREAWLTLGLLPEQVPDLPLLICMGFYSGLSLLNDAAAASAASSAST